VQSITPELPSAVAKASRRHHQARFTPNVLDLGRTILHVLYRRSGSLGSTGPSRTYVIDEDTAVIRRVVRNRIGEAVALAAELGPRRRARPAFGA